MAQGFPGIRVGYMTDKLPYEVNLKMPPVGIYDHKIPRLTGPILDVVVPSDPTRHLKLGLFLDAWSQLETNLGLLLSKILNVAYYESDLILSRLGAKNTVDLFIALASRKLVPEQADAIEALAGRLGNLNVKRNILVHGRWIFEANVVNKRGEAALLCQFLRAIKPIDPAHEQAMANPRNQKERVRYSFNLKRIDAATRDALSLSHDVGVLAFKVFFKPAENLGRWLAETKPYRVTYR